MQLLDLNGSWSFKARNANDMLPATVNKKITSWMPAIVPGTVHTDLLAIGMIPDPFFRMNENDVQWVDSLQWVYRREFQVPSSFLEEGRVVLVAEGLDTFATVFCNGWKVGETSNMFIAHRLDLKRFLRAGRNRIEIVFDSPVVRCLQLERRHGKRYVANEPHRVYARKAQYSFGWDWGPKLTTSGIWRDIRLEAYSSGRLHDPRVTVESVSPDEAVLRLSVQVERLTRRHLDLRAFVAGSNAIAEHTVSIQGKTVEFIVHVRAPQLWWPNGYGGQPMYKAVLSLLRGDEELHTLEVPVAIRTVRLLQEKDKEGSSFIIEMNGVKVFCKGADWIPSDNFIPRIPDTTYENLLTAARNASMNMIRVWGGGFYEQDIFYNLCDQLGLMVWQDFMYACGEYPEHPGFLRQAKEEAQSVVRRLRNHPSIALWCGNNECEWLYCTDHPGAGPDDMCGAKIFRDILADVCSAEDGTRPYWRSSPFGSGFPNSESNGNHHQWTVWSAWKDFTEYEKDTARFVTEFGFQAPANRVTLEEAMLSEDLHPQSRVMEHHNKQVEGPERLARFQAAHYRFGTDLDDFIYKGQLVQAEALKLAAEHWRRRKFDTAGVIFWQLNDCWPVSSWAVIDSALRPKAAYYFAKRFFAPILVSCRREERGVSVWLTNDRLKPCGGKLTVRLKSFSGRSVWKQQRCVSVGANKSAEVLQIDRGIWGEIDATTHYLSLRCQMDDGAMAENRFYFEDPKHLHLPRANVKATLVKGKEGTIEVVVESAAFAKNVRLQAGGGDAVFEDNYFDLDAGEKKTVRVLSAGSMATLRKGFAVRSLAR
jgi:beta-mannosidase